MREVYYVLSVMRLYGETKQFARLVQLPLGEARQKQLLIQKIEDQEKEVAPFIKMKLLSSSIEDQVGLDIEIKVRQKVIDQLYS